MGVSTYADALATGRCTRLAVPTGATRPVARAHHWESIDVCGCGTVALAAGGDRFTASA
jgi:hypothetical protein